MFEERIASKVFEAVDGGSIDPLVDWLITMGCKVLHRDKDMANLQGPVGVNSGFILTDPNTLAVQCGFALAGMLWPQVYPKLQTTVNRMWAERKSPKPEPEPIVVTPQVPKPTVLTKGASRQR